MHSFKNVIKSTAIYGFLGFLPAALRFFLFPIFVRYLSAEDYGIIALNTTFTTVLSILFSIGLSETFSVNFFRYHSNKKIFDCYFSTILISIISIGIIFSLLLYPTGNALFSIAFKDPAFAFHPYGTISILVALFGSVNAVILGYYRNSLQALKYFFLTFGTIALGTIFETIAIVYFKYHAEGILMARLLGMVLGSIPIYISLFTKIKFGFDIRYLKLSLGYALPLVGYSILTFVTNSYDRIMIENYLSLKDLGIYNVAFTIASLVEVGFYAVQYATAPDIYRLLKVGAVENADQINKIHRIVGLIVLVMASGVVLLSPVFINFFTRQEYAHALKLIPLLCAAFLMRYLYCTYVYPLFAFKSSTKLPFIAFISGLIVIGSNIILLPALGIFGSAISLFIVRLVQVALCYYLATKVTLYRSNLGFVGPVLIIITILFCASSFVHQTGPILYVIHAIPFILVSIIVTYKIKQNWLFISERGIKGLKNIFSK